MGNLRPSRRRLTRRVLTAADYAAGWRGWVWTIRLANGWWNPKRWVWYEITMPVSPIVYCLRGPLTWMRLRPDIEDVSR